MPMFNAVSGLGGGNYSGPDFNSGWDPKGAADLIWPRADYVRKQQQQFQKDLVNLQSTNRMKEFDNQLKTQEDYARQQRQGNPLTQGMNYQVSWEGGVNKPEIDPLNLAKLSQGQQRLSQQQQAEQDRNKLGQERVDVSQENTDLRRQGLTNPDYVQVRTAGGDIMTMNRKTGQIVDTGKPQGTQTQSDVQDQKFKDTLLAIAARGDQSVRNTEAQGAQSRFTKQTPPALNPGQITQQRKNNATEFVKANPDLAQFIKVDPNTGEVNIESPSTNWFGHAKGPTPEQYKAIASAVYGPGGAGLPGTSPESEQPQPNVPQSQQPSAPAQMILQDPKGNHYYYDPKKGSIPKGWKLVQGGE